MAKFAEKVCFGSKSPRGVVLQPAYLPGADRTRTKQNAVSVTPFAAASAFRFGGEVVFFLRKMPLRKP